MNLLNPINRILDEKEITATVLAAIAGVDLATVKRATRGEGASVGKRLLEAITSLGYNSEQVEREYQDWRAAAAKRILGELQKENQQKVLELPQRNTIVTEERLRQVNFRLPESLFIELKLHCIDNDRTLNDMCSQMVSEYLSKCKGVAVNA